MNRDPPLFLNVGDKVNVTLEVNEDCGQFVQLVAESPGQRKCFWIARELIQGVIPKSRES